MSKPKVAIQLPRIAHTENLNTKYELELEALGDLADLVEVESSTPQAFIEGARDAKAIITSWGIHLNRQIIEGLDECLLIALGSVGVDMVDVEAATEAGIVVTNCPDTFIEEVADHALMLMLAVGRHTKVMNEMARTGDWYKGRPLLNHVPRLMGQTLGLLAFGNVGRCVARRAQAFGMNVIAHDPYISELTVSDAGVEPVSFGELLDRSDYLSLHSALNEETRHIINGSALGRMKQSAVIINTARGPIIDETDLIDALQRGRIAGAGLDVLEQEPPDADNPLLTMENVVVTPHVASATTRMRPEARRRVGREVSLVLRGRWPMSAVNPTVLPRAKLERWQPYPMNRGPNR